MSLPRVYLETSFLAIWQRPCNSGTAVMSIRRTGKW